MIVLNFLIVEHYSYIHICLFCVLVFRIFYKNFSDNCAVIHNQVWVLLNPSTNFTHVATFGNSSISVTGDWVQIIQGAKPPVCFHTIIVEIKFLVQYKSIIKNVKKIH